MIIKTHSTIPSSEITPESIYLRRREFMCGSLALAATSATPAFAKQDNLKDLSFTPAEKVDQAFIAKDKKTPYQAVTTYNNFYEFGTDKSDPAKYADDLNVDPWSINISGHIDKPGNYALEDIINWSTLEERIYRLRCVEAWSMVIPWIGFPLADLIKKIEPNSKAKYIAFETLHRPKEMRGQRSRTSTIDWPYREALRMDEAMHPLTILAVGLYGKTLPNQNGAPIRLVVPWKYGFKSIKSIVKIKFTSRQPRTTWSELAPKEYGFYANVNPDVSHPRWSQATERRLPSTLWKPNRIKTEFLNGYADQVGGLYKGMDLKRYY